MKNFFTKWFPEKELIITQLSGELDEADIIEWEKTFIEALDSIADGGKFKILVNLYGFKAENFTAHKRFRTVVPVTLAAYGWKVGYVDLFEEEAKEISLTQTRGIRCYGAAHVHQDETKIGLYQSQYSSTGEQFFTDPEIAKSWIEGYQPKVASEV